MMVLKVSKHLACLFRVFHFSGTILDACFYHLDAYSNRYLMSVDESGGFNTFEP